MSRTYRKRDGWFLGETWDLPEWQQTMDYRSCWCCSQKRKRLTIRNRERRMKHSDAKRAGVDVRGRLQRYETHPAMMRAIRSHFAYVDPRGPRHH